MQASVGSHCVDCARAARPDVATRVKFASSRVLTPVTYTIIAINVLVFLWMGVKDPKSFGGGITQAHANLGLSRNILKYGVAYTDGSHDPTHQWYRLVTNEFIHFGFFHIGMNMLLLFQLGNLLERALGGKKLALMYFASLLAGSLGVIVVNTPGITGGASGAIFGLMAGAAVGLHRRGVNIFSTGIGTTLVLNLVLTFTISGISFGGHIGGGIGGAICGWVMLAPGWKPVPKWATWATPIAVAVLSVAASIIIVG